RIALSDWSTSVAIWRMSTGWRRSINSPAARSLSRNSRNPSPMLRPPRNAQLSPAPLCNSALHALHNQPLLRAARRILLGLGDMKALLLRRHGGLENLEIAEYPKPAAGAGQAVIRVRASSFNYHDVFTVRGMPGIKVPFPVVIGLDIAGEIA